ncbi:MAG: MmgE/PrpD family protein [Chloroflexi bacterium]|nr:MmgE/PrpD family protein [Chloroflexota bacterium]
MSVTEALAQKIVETTYETLPGQVIQVAREIVLDGVSNMLAGSQEPLGHIMGRYVRSLRGPQQVSVVGRNFKTHPVHAAFANGTFCHSMDYELMWYPPTHPTGPVLPALLALAEQRGYSGRQVVLALALAFEVQGRLRVTQEAIPGGAPSVHIHPPGNVGVLGNAAACAKLLGLDAWKTRMAIGIAASRISGLTANTGTMTKSTHCGHAARMGLESALLADMGYTGNEDILEARHGYNDIYYFGNLNLDLVLKDFGNPYRMVSPGLAVKKFPAQYPTHWSIDAALEIKRRHQLRAEEIHQVEVEVGADNESADRLRPKTGLDGKFSIAYTVSAALLDGKVVIDTFRDERRFAPDMEAMLGRITIKKNPEIKAMDFQKAWARVTVTMKNGQRYTVRVDSPLGRWDNPLPWEGRLVKFQDCAKRVLAEREAQQVVRLIEGFETLETVRPLMDVLRVPTVTGS